MEDIKTPEELLKKYYAEDNYKIVDFNHKKRTNICYVFFSSNGLYKDRNDMEIIRKMHESDRYEWSYISLNKKIRRHADRIIFLRDIFKIFYIRGISEKINTISKIKNLLDEETKGMKIIFAGSSAGAYMSLLFGNMMKETKRVIALGGVVDLEYFRTFSSYLDDNLDKCEFKNISNFLYGDYWTINFFGTQNNYDVNSADLLNKFANTQRLINVGMCTDTHAPRPSGEDLIKLLTCDDGHLVKLKKKLNDRKFVTLSFFGICNIGLFPVCYNKIKSKIVKTIRK